MYPKLIPMAPCVLSLFAVPMAFAQPGGPVNFRANLKGTSEVPLVASTGTAQFRATLQNNDTEIAWELDFSGLSGAPTQAHIHFGQIFASGGIVYWICGAAGPVGTAACPAANNGTLTGTVKAAAIVAVTTQGISANDFKDVLAAIRAGNAYVNVHTAQSPAGEIRGQIQRGGGLGRDKKDD